MREEVLRSERVYEGRVVNLRVDTVRLPNGKTSQREIVEHRGAVAIVPLLDKETVLMIRQFRLAVNEELLEVPAGTLEPDEPPEVCAARELEEETGYRAGALRQLFSQYLAPGYSQEILHVFLAQGLEKTVQRTEEDENVEVVPVPLSRAVDMVLSGEIRDAKTIAALLVTHYILLNRR
ncbi:MAG: ADP-ribose pyrophosphatase [Armatimonadota bacterium]|nr:MAG: ADP-ribose pyrophosphatase [Armatimonadota bacterium]